MAKVAIPKGTRISLRRYVEKKYVFDTIRSSFQRFGYLPLETPSMENLDTLMGKYGEEGDKLIFKILNSGNYFSTFKDDQEILEVKSRGERTFSLKISEKALRYDLTVPFARYVVMHQHEITFPFKRYQIQPVWRADRPQKGRYREFFQCDADVIGTNSLLCELELMQLMDDVFAKLDLKVLIQINNRKILSGIAEVLGETERIIDITVAIDKLDKIGVEKVKEELRGKGVSEKAIEGLQPLLEFKGDDAAKLNLLKELLAKSEIGKQGIAEVEQLFGYAGLVSFSHIRYELDITLARGLNYYTGAIFEVKVDDARSSFTSSICGGGRYDDLTGIFGLPGMSGVGISFGADRICDVLEEAKLFPEQNAAATKILVVNFGEEDIPYSLGLLQQLRKAGVNAEMYPDPAKMKKQFSYADDRGIPFVLVAGSEERKAGTVVLKNMTEGSQQPLAVDELISMMVSNTN
ncbi:MAG: histidine--tRNA ligase [Bacteroidetes bacterium]|nr:histidine--tRNA ligase [Bacteroidota bacterium]